MIKKLILSILAVVNFFTANAAVGTWNPDSLHCLPVAIGVFNTPLIPCVHTYTPPASTAAFILFRKVIPTPSGYIIFSVQTIELSSIFDKAAPIQFKPQWSIAKFPDSLWTSTDKDEYIAITANCNIKMTDTEGEQDFNFSEEVCFHNTEPGGPLAVSPDVMPLGFDGTSSLSKVIEYDVKYTNGRGSDFAKLKSDTCQKGIILVLNDEDREKFVESDLFKSEDQNLIPLKLLHDFLKNISIISGNESLKSKLGLA